MCVFVFQSGISDLADKDVGGLRNPGTCFH